MKHSLDYKKIPKYKIYMQRAANRFPEESVLSEDQFNNLSKQSCFYCGKEGPNGIDRKDNNRGYIYSNCVPCCKHCNYVKGNLSLEDFNTWKDRFVEKQLEQLSKKENA